MPKCAIGGYSTAIWAVGRVGGICMCAIAVPPPTLAAPNNRSPILFDSVTGWLKPPGDEFLSPPSGLGPIKSIPPPLSPTPSPRRNGQIADDQPDPAAVVVQQMRKANDEVLAGKVGFTARSRCLAARRSRFPSLSVHPIFSSRRRSRS